MSELRIIDANINRLREGIRTAEDVLRFVYNDEKGFQKLKELRHKINTLVADRDFLISLLESRESNSDVGEGTLGDSERKRDDDFQLLRASFVRAQEASRVLEEVLKKYSIEKSETAKSIRFSLYSIEKEALLRLNNAR